MKFSPELTNRIIEWKESLTVIPTDLFLDYARMYLGEIETPFNKQNLVTQIAAFFCQDENKKNIMALLGENDLKILSLIHLITDSTKESIVEFFESESDSFTIRAHLKNLEERLIIFYSKKKQNEKKCYCINPVIEEALGAKIGMSVLIQSKKIETAKSASGKINLNSIFLASVISFILSHPDLCKENGGIKKRALKDFASICGFSETEISQDSDFQKSMEVLISAFRNLLLFSEKNGVLVPDWARLLNFSNLPEIHQFIYLCVASCWSGHSRQSLSTCAQLLTDTLFSMGERCYSRKMILRLAFLINSLSPDERKTFSRFETLMAKISNEEMNFSPLSKLDQILDSCIALGLLKKLSDDENSNDFFYASPIFYQSKDEKNLQQKEKFISVEAGFSVTIMPGQNLEKLLPLVKFLDIKHFDVVAGFEITHKSVLRAFDFGMDLNAIKEILVKSSGFEIPQNLEISLEDWYNSYSSATLYHGYVLTVNAENMILAQKNPVLSKHIIARLAEGVLLLDFKDDFEASAIIAHSGLNFIGKVKTCSKEIQAPSLPLIRKTNLFLNNTDECKIEKNEKETEKFLQSMKDKLDAMNLTSEQKEGLLSRINRRIIVNENQLQAATVHFDKTEASALDNSGKIYIIEKAIQEENLVEITVDKNSLPQVGLPINLDKKNATVTIRKKDGTEFTIPISLAIKVKKVRIEFQF